MGNMQTQEIFEEKSIVNTFKEILKSLSKKEKVVIERRI
jgi:capsular polysaccharide biosynthesis protein